MIKNIGDYLINERKFTTETLQKFEIGMGIEIFKDE